MDGAGREAGQLGQRPRCVLDRAERSGGASAVAAGGGTATAQAMARKRGSSGAAAAGGSDALLGPALGKQGSRAKEGERGGERE